MKVRATATARLSDEHRRLLLEGPWACGLTLLTMPPHDELAALWRLYGPALLATCRHPWVVERLWYVDQIRGVR